jgi:hypothetical protein
MRHHAHGGQDLVNEQPARARFQRDLDVLTGELLDPLADRLSIGSDPAAHDLARPGVQGVEGDLRPVHIDPS